MPKFSFRQACNVSIYFIGPEYGSRWTWSFGFQQNLLCPIDENDFWETWDKLLLLEDSWMELNKFKDMHGCILKSLPSCKYIMIIILIIIGWLIPLHHFVPPVFVFSTYISKFLAYLHQNHWPDQINRPNKEFWQRWQKFTNTKRSVRKISERIHRLNWLEINEVPIRISRLITTTTLVLVIFENGRYEPSPLNSQAFMTCSGDASTTRWCGAYRP